MKRRKLHGKIHHEKSEVSAENQHRLFRFLSDFTCSAYAGVFQYAGVHGGGSPIMEKIGIRSFYDLESKKISLNT